MFEKVIEQLTKDMGKKKDKWLLETLEKHNLIKSSDITNFDIFWLKEELGVRGVNVLNANEDKTQIYIKDQLIGEWINNYKLFKKDDFEYEVRIRSWN